MDGKGMKYENGKDEKKENDKKRKERIRIYLPFPFLSNCQEFLYCSILF